MTWKDEALWNYHKQKGKALCERPLGYVIFDIRPLSPVLQRYACNDVEYMPAAFAEISEVLCEQDGWMERVKESQKLANVPPHHSGHPFTPKIIKTHYFE